MNTKTSAHSQQQIYQRLAQLDEETQKRISLKYYHGARPWLPHSKSARKKRVKAEETAE